MEILQEIGLTQREIKVYLALLELGSTTTGPIIKKSEVPNSKIYEVLESLQNKGLVSWIIKGKIKYFQASNPRHLLTSLKDKERKIEEILPQLEMKQKLGKTKKSVELFEGIKAIRSMLQGLVQDIRKGEDWYGFSTGVTSANKEIEDFYEWWGALKINIGLKDHLLISLSNKKEFLNSLSKDAKRALGENKSLKFSQISFPGDTAIFRNYVIIFNWNEIPTSTLITNENLARQYKDFFLGLWNQSKK
jgi:HTH-type transcriptional regulator, sugar sensing transcriptional regulator